jgi:hypothetical protein
VGFFYKQVRLTAAICVLLTSIGIQILDALNAAPHVKPVRVDFRRIAAFVQLGFTKTFPRISVLLVVQQVITVIPLREFVRVAPAIVKLA